MSDYNEVPYAALTGKHPLMIMATHWGDEYTDNTRGTVDEYLEWFLDGSTDFDGEMKVFAFKPVAVKLNVEWILENTLKFLDGEYTFKTDPPSAPNDAMTTAAEAFVKTIEQEYVPTEIEMCGSVIVDTWDWISDNNPDWIKQYKGRLS